MRVKFWYKKEKVNHSSFKFLWLFKCVREFGLMRRMGMWRIRMPTRVESKNSSPGTEQPLLLCVQPPTCYSLFSFQNFPSPPHRSALLLCQGLQTVSSVDIWNFDTQCLYQYTQERNNMNSGKKYSLTLRFRTENKIWFIIYSSNLSFSAKHMPGPC